MSCLTKCFRSVASIAVHSPPFDGWQNCSRRLIILAT